MGSRSTRNAVSVDAYIAALEHPRKADIEQLRALILACDARIGEEVKWNAPSFHVAGAHFATMRLTGRLPVLRLILHLGAKKARIPDGAIDDPQGVLRWLAPDRACVDFDGAKSVAALGEAVRGLVRQWIQYVPGVAPD